MAGVSQELCKTRGIRVGIFGPRYLYTAQVILILWRPGEPPASFARFATGRWLL